MTVAVAAADGSGPLSSIRVERLPKTLLVTMEEGLTLRIICRATPWIPPSLRRRRRIVPFKAT
jgi:hypothetical protein